MWAMTTLSVNSWHANVWAIEGDGGNNMISITMGLECDVRGPENTFVFVTVRGQFMSITIGGRTV
jgi:hypothetical protein